jgi:hypothetical protein
MPKKKSTRKRARPRARRDEDVIDVEAEPVEGAAAPAPRAPIVVHVKGKETESLPNGGGAVRVRAVDIRATLREVKEAAEVGREIGEFLAGLLRR